MASTPDFQGGAVVPFVTHAVAAGFASPAQDFLEERVDLDRELIENELTTFYIRVAGTSMTGAGIDDGDILVVDRSLEPVDGKIAICIIDGDFTVKRLKLGDNCLYLMPENPKYKPLLVTEESQFSVWGIVTYVVKKL